jgi:hypothetical protein
MSTIYNDALVSAIRKEIMSQKRFVFVTRCLLDCACMSLTRSNQQCSSHYGSVRDLRKEIVFCLGLTELLFLCSLAWHASGT